MRPSEALLQGARIVTPDGVIEDGYVRIAEGVIESVGPGRGGSAGGLDLEGRWVLPGFVDVHVHGGAGADFMSEDPDDHLRAARFHAGHGTTTLLATALSASPDRLLRAVKAAARAMQEHPAGARIAGIHLEGPFISPHRAGAHDPSALRLPDPSELDRLWDGSGGAIRMMTLAPELPGAGTLIRHVKELGAIPAVGHTDASFSDVVDAVASGASHITHTFNSMRGLHHRDPGALGAALVLEELTCELIMDGVHVAPPAARVVYLCKGPERSLLVTDAMAAAGMPEGRYPLGTMEVDVMGGRAHLAGTDTLAGSTLTMEKALRNAIQGLGIGMREATLMASTTPARVLGLSQETGAIAPQRRADLVILNDDLDVFATLVGGLQVFGPELDLQGS